MHYAIVVNLDYASQPEEDCRELWRDLRQRMQQAGFRCDGRTFTIETGENEASSLARSIIDDIDASREANAPSVFMYLKDFYGFDMDCTTNLLLPPTTSIELDGENT